MTKKERKLAAKTAAATAAAAAAFTQQSTAPAPPRATGGGAPPLQVFAFDVAPARFAHRAGPARAGMGGGGGHHSSTSTSTKTSTSNGDDVVAVERGGFNEYHGRSAAFAHVRCGGVAAKPPASAECAQGSGDYALLLCYPPPDSDMALQALQRWQRSLTPSFYIC
jgi:hypothetical protein